LGPKFGSRRRPTTQDQHGEHCHSSRRSEQFFAAISCFFKMVSHGVLHSLLRIVPEIQKVDSFFCAILFNDGDVCSRLIHRVQQFLNFFRTNLSAQEWASYQDEAEHNFAYNSLDRHRSAPARGQGGRLSELIQLVQQWKTETGEPSCDGD
jgi:hypothetical protein